jgi:hypothetical protein
LWPNTRQTKSASLQGEGPTPGGRGYGANNLFSVSKIPQKKCQSGVGSAAKICARILPGALKEFFNDGIKNFQQNPDEYFEFILLRAFALEVTPGLEDLPSQFAI